MLKYYRDPETGLVYSYPEDGSQDATIPSSYVELTEDEVNAHLYPPPAGVIVPQEISKAQGLLALIHFDYYQAMQDLIASIADPAEKLKAEINVFQRNTWERKNPALLTLAGALGLSDAELDEMFIYGFNQ